jgi:hypothetical protein
VTAVDSLTFEGVCDRDGCYRIAVWTVTPASTTVACLCEFRWTEQVRRWVDSEGRALL